MYSKMTALALAAHGLSEFRLFDELSIVPASTLAAPIGVVYQSRNRASASQSHLEGGAAKLRTHVILHRPTDDLTRGHVLHASQIKPAFVRVDIGDIGQLNGIRRLAMEFLFQQVWGWLQLMIAVRCDWLSTLAKKRRHLVFLHYSRNTALGDDLTIRQ